ncbi:PREDICTED: polycomb protein Sfmbt-like isoform X1 [Ceratosolen solmsi marchali]|uniref:Polycomb protein Sfmbt-like isoform X1 n=1 Tax=Ceratosolen solmsi marchali TaxID=326594 RepID=A0AAJ7DYG2_9HYME|nr:PREDICTED: polycomb protein Sfmbt-like isoform X1 [Ceratosolen solmsi marchali]
MDMQAPNVYAAIPGMPELGMVWMGDMMVHNDPTQELMIDPRQAESSFYSHGPHSFDDIRNHQIPPTTMVRYLAPQFHNECSESEEPMEGVDVQDIQQEYDQTDGQEMNEYLGLEDYTVDEEREQVVSNAATQTQDIRNRKIKPIKHPGLVLKTPIAYQPHTDLNFIPIRKDGIAVCEKCGAIGVKHAFYTKERRFCSRACARSSEHTAPHADSTYSPTHSIEQNVDINLSNDVKPLSKISIKEEVIQPKEQIKKEKIKAIIPAEPVMPEELPVRRKRTAEMAGSYDWTPQLKTPGFCAAPVSCFKHAPISEIWDNISVGMKVEVENTDCDEVCEAFPDSFWVATVLRISGYRALLRYEGFGHSVEKDFWVSLCSNDIHPVGWCATIGKPLIPPNTIANKYKDWKDFLMRRLTGARTLPTNFYSKVNDSMKSRFRCGLHLEVVDKNRISQVKVATIQKIVGKRLHVRYYDSSPEDNGFWCHEDSPLIHAVGWAKHIGQTLDAYPEYLQRIEMEKLSEDDAKSDLFYVTKNHLAHYGYTFREGMKIEAIDPLNLSAICAATVMQVLKDSYIMIRIDSYDEDTSGSDWFCYHSCSPCIFPVGFCAQHGLPLTPPKGYDPTTFTWDSYLEETNTIPAPAELFNREIPQHGFIEGMRLEAADLMDPRLVCVATITRVIGRLLRVHFDGWEDEYDQWLDCQSPDIYPVGWCDLVDHKLEGPRVHTKNTSPTVKSPRGLKRKGKRKLRKVVGNKPAYAKNILPRQLEQQQQTNNQHQQQQQQQQRRLAREHYDRQLGPTQGTKIERERGDLESSIPEQATAREPEPAQEPAGPDQTLPSPTSGQGQSTSDSQNDLQGPPPPKERTATSYINVTATSSKYIPRLADGLQKNSELGELVPVEWNVFDVAQFLRVNDCATYCDNFSKRKIDGKMLLTLTKDQIIDLTGFKVGPSLKIFDLIQQLKIKVNPAQERLKLGLKKIL